MRNRDNDLGGILINLLKAFGLAFLLFLLKYVAMAVISIGLVVGMYYLIKEHFTK